MSFLVNSFFAKTDPFWSSVVLLAPFNLDQLDHSTAARTLTAVGTPTLTSAFSPPFQTNSSDLDGTTDAHTAADSADFAFGSGDFTVEGFLYHQALIVDAVVTQFQDTGNQRSWGFFNDGDGLIEFYWSTNGTNQFVLTYNHSAQQSSWRHFAFSRVGNTGYLCWDKVIRATVDLTGATLHDSTAALAIGANKAGTSAFFNGGLAQIRITKGVGRYSGAINDAITANAPFPES